MGPESKEELMKLIAVPFHQQSHPHQNRMKRRPQEDEDLSLDDPGKVR